MESTEFTEKYMYTALHHPAQHLDSRVLQWILTRRKQANLRSSIQNALMFPSPLNFTFFSFSTLIIRLSSTMKCAWSRPGARL